MTGQREMSTDAFREYFKPLEDWLIKQNQKNNVKVGWKNPPIDQMCKQESSGGNKHNSFTFNFSILMVFLISCSQILG